MIESDSIVFFIIRCTCEYKKRINFVRRIGKERLEDLINIGWTTIKCEVAKDERGNLRRRNVLSEVIKRVSDPDFLKHFVSFRRRKKSNYEPEYNPFQLTFITDEAETK